MAAISQQQQQQLPAAMEATAAAAAPAPVTVSPAEAARDPLAAVAALHSARVSSLSGSSSSPSAPAEDGDWGVMELFRAVAEDEGLAKTVRSFCLASTTRDSKLIKIDIFVCSPSSLSLYLSLSLPSLADSDSDLGKRRLDPAARAREVPRHGKWIGSEQRG